jgi:Carboxypeptidase regulatory-like domain/TonB-dependent Receptor Plug Domain/TonB dependent receptor
MKKTLGNWTRLCSTLLWMSCMLVVGYSGTMFAQDSGTLLGHLTDGTGAAVPNAKVSFKNTGTGYTRDVVSDAQGNYIATQLPIGSFDVGVSVGGFGAQLVHNAVLQLGQNLRVDFTLSVGQVQQMVTVEGSNIAQVDTHSATLSSEIEQTRILNLPLNGRDPASLLLTVPGVSTLSVPTSPGISGDTATINGTNASSQEFLIDGVPFNAVQRSDGDPMPPPDMFQEFRVLTNSYSSQYGRNGGAVIVGATRSGTNRFHGSLWEFVRNNDLNTKNYFASTIPALHQNQFGAAVGGPVMFPGYNGRDRTFFYGGYQGTRIRQNALASSAVPPTTAELGGVFASSTPIIDPQTGQQFQNNTIPTMRFDSAALNVLKLVPSANQANGSYFVQASQPTNSNAYLARVEQKITSSNTLTGRVWHDNRTITYPFGANTPSNVMYTPGVFNVEIYSGVLSDTQIISPNLVNRFDTGFLRRAENRFNTVKQDASSLGIQIARPVTPFLPNIAVNGRLSLQATINGQPTKLDNNFYLEDTVTWTHHGNEFAFGMTLEKPNFKGQPVFDNGTFVFDGSRTRSASVKGSGSTLADFLLGLPASFSQSTARYDDDRTQLYGFFAQDDWKVSSRLTLNLGLRYEYNQPMYNAHGYHATFVPGIQSTRFPSAPKGLLYPGDQGLPAALYYADKNNFAPRIGFAYDPRGNGKSSIRAGYGVFYQLLDAEFSNYLNGNLPFQASLTLLNPNSFSQPWAPTYQGGVNDPVTVYHQNLGTTNATFVYPSSGYSIDPHIRNGYVQQFNLSFQQQGPWKTTFQAAYVGTLGRKLGLAYDQNPGIFNPANPTAAVNSTRAYDPGVLTTMERFISANNSNYNALQLSFNRRYGNGLVLSSSYTYGKSFDLYSSPAIGLTSNPFNLNFDHGLSDFDRTHVFNSSAVWELPFWKNSEHWALRSMIAGWQLSGLLQLQSGLPLNVLDGQDISKTGEGLDRPNVAGDPQLPTNRSHQQKAAQYFNTTAYTVQTVGTFGNSPRNPIFGPGYADLDFALMKDFRITENTRFELRGEAFNSLNHVNFGNPDGRVSDGPSFGRITSALDPRLVQLAGKLYF